MRLGPALAVGVLGCALAACGADTPPGDAAPAVAQRLDQVDDAVSRGDLPGARRAVEALVREADRAESAGDLTQEQAERIDAAADQLLNRLPDASTTGTTETATTPTAPTTTETPDDESEDGDAPGNSDHAGEHGHGRAKGHDED